MFIQIIQGRCTRQDELRAHAGTWRDELAPGAKGWLGGTYGFTDDDQFVGIVRFESKEAATANSERPEQGAWAERFMALMDGPVEFHDCDDVTLMMDGGSDSAGFVQVIRGRVNDPDRLKALMTDTEMLHEARPDILGATLAFEDDGTFTETIAFTTEAEARDGEQREMPDMPADVRETLDAAMQGATFWDLHRPWFESR
ncbi:hypothetical protein GCM10009623_17020 [Nocardioides aestuarii]|uniref:ABM domain-containing protein n=1 Tax=Nocardioides aestuarii TaxID=252231 RepID=A0ABW4TLR8_9ACTN